MTKKQELTARIKELQAQLEALLRARPKVILPLTKRKADAVVETMTALGYKVMVYQGYRSFEEQDKLYAQGRTTAGAIVTNARGGESLHNYGVAFDIVFVVNGKPSWDNKHPWNILGTVGKAHGLEWGGDWVGFVDRPHFQITLGYTLSDFKTNKVDYRKFL